MVVAAVFNVVVAVGVAGVATGFRLDVWKGGNRGVFSFRSGVAEDKSKGGVMAGVGCTVNAGGW